MDHTDLETQSLTKCLLSRRMTGAEAILAGQGEVMQLAVQVELPLGATEDRICGTINIEKALQEGVKAYEPGLLVRAFSPGTSGACLLRHPSWL